MGLEDAAAYWRTREGFELILIGVDGAVYITEGLENVVEISGEKTVLRRK